MSKQRYFPLFIDLSDRKVVVVGSGKSAERKILTLLDFTRHVTVIAPELTESLQTLALSGHIVAQSRSVKKSDLAGAYLVIAASEDKRLNDAVCRFCHEQGIYVNVLDRQEDSDFFFPGICMEDDIVVGVSTTADNHHRARVLRASIQKMMDAFSKHVS